MVLSVRAVSLLTALWIGIGAAQAEPLLLGVDHIPVVVRDLEKAQADFERFGFAIKPGRFHEDGIRNVHVKFPDGTEIELITAPKAVDALTSEYRAKLERGEGPIYFGLYAPDRTVLTARLKAAGVAAEQDGFGFSGQSLLHPLFFGPRNKSPTDRPEHFAHANGALRVSAFWVRDLAPARALLSKLDVPLHDMPPCGPLQGQATAAQLPEGHLTFVPPQSGTGNVVAAQVEVRDLVNLKRLLAKNGVAFKEYGRCGPQAVWVSPEAAHGIWLQFVQGR